MAATDALVFDAIRTPRGKGKSNGSLHTTKPVDLVVGLMHEMLARNVSLDPARIDDVVLGCVSPVGDQGADIAKTAAIKAGLPDTVAGVQLNRFCASGLEAVNIAAQKVASGWEDLVFAGGVESMSRVPMGSDGGAWAMDPETNYDTSFIPQGVGADLIATVEDFSRDDVDAYAARSQERAATAQAEGRFAGTTGPAPASKKALAKAGIGVEDLDLVEINEAFAAVVLRFVRDMGLDMEKVNVNGGAIAMGHPLGATGGMILGTLVDELHRTGGRYGLATLCVGGGMGIATVVEAIR